VFLLINNGEENKCNNLSKYISNVNKSHIYENKTPKDISQIWIFEFYNVSFKSPNKKINISDNTFYAV
jgi:hypothetical protein